MNHGNLHIPHDMKCGKCQHDASDHWYSFINKVNSGDCHKCPNDGPHTVRNTKGCYEFKFDNLNYIEVMAYRREQEKGLV